MKKVKFILSLMTVLAFSAVMTSCGNDDPAPEEVVETPNPDCEGSLAQEGTIVDGKITTFPFTITPTFTPSGYYAEGHQDVDFSYSCEDQNITFVFTKGPAAAPIWWGASFINAEDWDARFSIASTAAKITFEAKFDYNANVVFTPFPGVPNGPYGAVKTLAKATTPVATPVWEPITIDLTKTPVDYNGTDAATGFVAPLGIVIENTGHLTEGQTVTIQIRNVKFETAPAP